MLRVGTENLREVVVFKGVDPLNLAVPNERFGVFFAQTEELHRRLFERVEFVFRLDRRDEDANLRGGRAVFAVFEPFDPASFDVIESIALFRLAAVDHEVVEEVVMPRAFPDLRMHDDRAVESDHAELIGRAGKKFLLVVARDHVVPPRVFDVSFEEDAQRTVVPEAVQPAVNFT